ncbi:hypothetical protein [uncultured Methanobrevibacter sp.]|uniref:hypothetical protein n=1 Tax=uncultured Methanobrevibacter sp. TaxID=253161 RepID=UPI0025EC5795|nr:hypothetical protein [uncultured Methanobrevibacter sp.]
MKSKKYMLVVLSILMILFVFVSSAGAADANTTDVLSVDESANMVNNEMDVLSIDESVNFENNETNILSADNNVNNDEILGKNDLGPDDLDIDFPKKIYPNKIFSITISASSYLKTMPTGDFNLTLEGVTYTGDIKGAKFDITNGIKKTTNATIFWPGDDNYNPFSTSFEIPVQGGGKKDVNPTFSQYPNPAKPGAMVDITVSNFGDYSVPPTGTAYLTIGKNTYKSNVANSFPINAQAPEKTSEATLAWGGDDNYNSYKKTFDIIVESTIPTNITVNPTSLDLTLNENGTINATLDPSEAGGLEVVYNETIIKVEQNEVTREWIVNALAEGKTNITFSFAGSEGYAAAENKTVTVTVNAKPAPSINVVAENLTKYYGGSEQFSVNVTDEEGKGIPGKNVSILINGVNYNRATDENGIAHLNITLPSGEYVANVTVDDITVNATVTVLPTVSGSDIRKVYGQKASYNATFLDEEGEYLPNGTEVSFNINGDIQNETISDDNGLASLNINLPVGEYIVTATNPVTGENASNTITVTQAESDIIVNGKNITVSDVDAVIADIVLPGDATGNVSVTIGDNTTVYDVQTSNHTSRGGELVMFISNNGLNVGEYNISAVYEGDTNYKASTASDQFVVSDKKYLNIIANAEPITVGENATVVVTGLENATGEVSVIIKVDEMYSAPINEGVATVIVPGLTETVTADVIYLGDDNYNPANTTVEIIVSSPGKMNLTISASAEPITVGENATVVVTGFPLTSYGSPSGNVTVTVGDKIFSGTLEPYMMGGLAAEIIVPGLNETTIAEVNYLGDEFYNSASTTVNITVYPKEKENANMSLYAPEIGESENATIYVTLPEDATGTVTATDQGENFTADVVNGTAIIILPVSDTNRTVPVTYSGDDKYYSETKEVNITVVDSSDIIIAPDVTKYYGGPERFVVTVTDYKGNPLVNKTVNININGRNYTRNTNESGVASLAINLPSNEYNATVSIKYRDPVHAIITVLSTVNGTDVVKMYRNDTQYYATFLDAEGKFLADGTDVKFNINGVMYDRKVFGDKGLAKLNINLPAGEYVITAINPVTGENAANNITVLSTVVENRDIVKYYRNATQYTVTVLGADGNPVGEGKLVTFNINGVLYQRQTDASSIAQLNINLPPGNYVITASYDECSVSNDITVLPVLSASDLRMKYMDGSKFRATLLDGQGKPYAEQKVQFNVNGVLYSRTTDSNGQAELNIRLPSGEYIITSNYNGANIANKITITP